MNDDQLRNAIRTLDYGLAKEKREHAIDHEAAQTLWCVIAEIAEIVDVAPDGPDACRNTIRAVRELRGESK